MKRQEFEKIIRETPTYYAVFELICVPYWLEGKFQKGDRIFAKIDHAGYLDGIRSDGLRISLKSSYVKFIEYKAAREISDEFNVRIENLLPAWRGE